MRGLDNPQLGNKPVKIKELFIIVAVHPILVDIPSGKLAYRLVIHFQERLVFLNFVETQGILFLVFQMSIASFFFSSPLPIPIFFVFVFYLHSVSFYQEPSLSSSFGREGFEPPWELVVPW